MAKPASQDVDAIAALAREFVAKHNRVAGQRAEVEVSTVDPRLRLAPCAHGMEAFFPAGSRVSGNTTVGVRCRGPEPWTVYVSVTARLFGTVLVAARSLPRTTVLKEQDLRPVERDLTTLLSGYVSDPATVCGMRLKRTLPIGGVLTQAHIEVPKLVRRGESVTVVARQPGLEVRVTGKALSDGTMGQRVRVRNPSSNKVVEGVVTGRGTVASAM